MKKLMMSVAVVVFTASAFAETNDTDIAVNPVSETVQSALVAKYGNADIGRFSCAEAANALAEYAANPEAGVLDGDLDALKRLVLRSALGIVKRSLREHGRTFVVGPDGSNPVQEVLDGLSAALNAPRMSGLSAWVAEWCPSEYIWKEPVWMTDEAVAELEDALYYGERNFGKNEQIQLCAALGVVKYNLFVAKYNGDSDQSESLEPAESDGPEVDGGVVPDMNGESQPNGDEVDEAV